MSFCTPNAPLLQCTLHLLSKNELNDTYIIKDKVKENIVDEGLNVLKTSFPEITGLLSETELRNLIYLNINSHE